MKLVQHQLGWLTLLVIFSFFIAGCSSDDDHDIPRDPSQKEIGSDTFTADVSLKNGDKKYDFKASNKSEKQVEMVKGTLDTLGQKRDALLITVNEGKNNLFLVLLGTDKAGKYSLGDKEFLASGIYNSDAAFVEENNTSINFYLIGADSQDKEGKTLKAQAEFDITDYSDKRVKAKFSWRMYQSTISTTNGKYDGGQTYIGEMEGAFDLKIKENVGDLNDYINQ